MINNPVTVLLSLLFIYPLIKGFILKYNKTDMEKDLLGIEGNIVFLISLIAGIIVGQKIFIEHSPGFYGNIFINIPVYIKNIIESKPMIIFFIIFPILIMIIYNLLMTLINVINRLTFYPILGGIDEGIRGKGFFQRVFGMIFQIPRGLSYILIAVFILNIMSGLRPSLKFDNYLGESNAYNYINNNVISKINNSKLAQSIPNLLNNSFKIVIKKSDNQGQIVYYNGVTLDEGIKSNEDIDSLARKLVKNEKTDKAKGKVLYTWVGENISYDNRKAERILNNDFTQNSGAITAFNTRKGICFDYACLYVAMCRANNIKVRLITGEGYNGETWVSHAWNQIYLEDEDKWISVDPTFYVGGNYFNSPRFLIDHRNAEIAGEW